MADNAGNNDTAIKKTCHILGVDPAHRRARCLAHILNLAAKAFIFGNSVEAFEKDTEAAEAASNVDTKRMEAAQRQWRKAGAIGKLHNIIVFIRKSTQRLDAFNSIKTGDDDIDSR